MSDALPAPPAPSDPAPRPASSALRRRLLSVVGAALVLLLAIVWWRASEPLDPTNGVADRTAAPPADRSPADRSPADGRSTPSPAPEAPPPTDSTPPSPASPPAPPSASEPPPSAPPPVPDRPEPARPEPDSPESRPAEPAAPTEPPPPWQAALEQAEPTPLEEAAYATFDLQREIPARQELQQWFEPVAGHGLRVLEQNVAIGRLTMFDGAMRLRAPLPTGMALQMQLESLVRLTIHCYSGRRGVAFVHLNDDADRWVAYATERPPGQMTPEHWAWTASDEGRVRRSGVRTAGLFQLQRQEGRLAITYGDVELTSAPLDGPLDDVYFAGRVMPFGIRLIKPQAGRPAGPPADDAPDAPPVAADLRRSGAELAWAGTPESGVKAEGADGVWRMAAEKAPKRGWFAAPLPGDGLHETILELGDVTPGAGLFLSDGTQPPVQVLRFVRDPRTGQIGLTPQAAESDATQQGWGPPTDSAVPYVGSSPWVRIVWSAAGVRWWIGVDGRHWAEPAQPAPMPWRFGSHLGVQHVANVEGVGLSVRSVTRRPLSALQSLAPAELQAQAKPSAAADLGAWESETAASKPASADDAAWRRACALKTLAAGPSIAFGPALVDRLLDDARAAELPAARQLRLLSEAERLLDVRNQAPLAVALATRYHRLGLDVFLRDGERPVTAVRPAFLSASLESRHAYPYVDPSAVRCELLARLYEDDWQGTVEFCRRTRFYHQHAQTPIFEWADALARRTTPGPDHPAPETAAVDARGRANWRLRRGRFPGGASKLKASWQHPLAEELSKETYNALAELQGMLDGRSFDDAARTIAAFDLSQSWGVAPAADDGQLLETLASAVRRAALQHPPLDAALERQFSAIAPLRVRQAIQVGDPLGVQRVAATFPGTSAVSDAHRWLGDHALAQGWFALAQAEYRRALLKPRDDAARADLAARLRLAAAMTGVESGRPATQAVTFGERTMSAAEFEALTAEMRSRAGGHGDASSGGGDEPTALSPPPGPRTLQIKAPLDGPLGENPAEEATPHLNRFGVDWPGRQAALAIVGDRLLVNNRFQLAAYDLASGQRVWQSTAPADKKFGKARDYGLTAMRPLVVGDRIYARQLYQDGPALGCWELATGRTIWIGETIKGTSVVSDPFLLQGRLATLNLVRSEAVEGSLRLTTYDADRGQPLDSTELVKLQPSWQARRLCAVRPLEDGFVVALGGIVLRCDGWGRTLWLRRQVVLPADEEPQWVTQAFAAPLARDGRLYSVQPGVRAVECLDADTGRLVWRRCLPDVRQIVGWSADRLLVLTDRGCESLSPTDGATQWRNESLEGATAALFGANGLVLVTPQKAADSNRRSFVLRWIDPASGRMTAEHPVRGLDDEQPRLDGFLHHAGRWWALAGKGLNDARRDLVELAPGG